MGVVAILATLTITAVGAAASGWMIQSSRDLTDLQTTELNATDGAHARMKAVRLSHGRTRVRLMVTGLDRLASGSRFGAHVHTGPCVEGDGVSAGPHYTVTGSAPLSEREVWLDFTVGRGGTARASATVDFVIPQGGARAIVVHAMPTAVDGTAGPRMACIPVDF
ncbi:MAG: superoxide dismutase family protein [Acidimicrobiales bacterium]